MPVDWNAKYEKRETPWNSSGPCSDLVRILDEGWIRPCPTVDIGCGTGSDALFLAGRGFDVTAADVSPLAVDEARRRASALGLSIRFLVRDALEGFGEVSSVPFVLDNGFYHYIRTVDLRRYLEVLSGLVAPGGAYITFVGNPNDTAALAGGPFRVTARDVCADFEADFELVQLREFRFHAVTILQGEHRPLGWSALFRRKGAAPRG